MKSRVGVSLMYWIALVIILIWSFSPILLTVVSSFKAEKDIFTYVPTITFRPILDNYKSLIREWPEFWAALRNSLIVTISSAILVAVTSIPAAYSYSRMRARGLSLTALFLIAVRMFPPIVITIPLYPLFQRLHLIDTPISLILLYSAFSVSLSVWILKAFFDGVPKDLEEAAWIDGCTRLQSFRWVMLPLIVPGLISAIIFVCLFAWNDFMFAFLFTSIRAKTAPVLIREMLGAVGAGGINWGTVFAATTIQLIPMLLFIWLIQKRLVKGMTLGAVKG